MAPGAVPDVKRAPSLSLACNFPQWGSEEQAVRTPMSFGDQLDNASPQQGFRPQNQPPAAPFGREKPSSSACSAIRSSIARLGENVNKMNQMVSQLGTHRDTHELRVLMRETRQETNRIVRQTKDGITLLSNPTSYQNSDWRIQQARLRKDFEAELKRLKDVSTKSIELEKAFVAKARSQQNTPNQGSADDKLVSEHEERRSLIEAEQERERDQHTLQMDNMIQYNENLIAERDEEVRSVEHDVCEINDIFKDLAVMVNDQGSKLGNIEDYITTANVNTEQANEEIDKSYIQQKKARKRTCLLVIILLTALLIFLLIVTRSLTSDK